MSNVRCGMTFVCLPTFDVNLILEERGPRPVAPFSISLRFTHCFRRLINYHVNVLVVSVAILSFSRGGFYLHASS